MLITSINLLLRTKTLAIKEKYNFKQNFIIGSKLGLRIGLKLSKLIVNS